MASSSPSNAESVVLSSWSSFKDLLRLYAVEYTQSTHAFFGAEGSLFRVQITLTALHYNWMHRCEGAASSLVAATIIALADASSVMAKQLPQDESQVPSTSDLVKSTNTPANVVVEVHAGASGAFGNTSCLSTHLLHQFAEANPSIRVDQLFPADQAPQVSMNDDAVSWLYRMQDKKLISLLKFDDQTDMAAGFVCKASCILLGDHYEKVAGQSLDATWSASNKKRAKDLAANELRQKLMCNATATNQ
jgi:hypothetical protein